MVELLAFCLTVLLPVLSALGLLLVAVVTAGDVVLGVELQDGTCLAAERDKSC